MTVQVTIIGLGQIGASIGLALAPQKGSMARMGNDIDHATARQALKLGAVDHLEVNLPTSVRSADLVILALPQDQLRPTVEAIAADLHQGCVLMDTAPARQAVMEWMPAVLPGGVHYVGLTPALNPAVLTSSQLGIAAARADLFQGGQIGIAAFSDTEPGALKMAADLAGLLGASPMFTEAAEIDGVMAAIHVLPQLMAAALLQATVEQPGWREMRRIAGLPYQQVGSGVLHTSAAALAAQAVGNRANTLRMLDDALNALQNLRQDLAGEDPAAFEARLEDLRGAQEAWWSGRLSKEWRQEGAPDVPMPKPGGMLRRLLGIREPKPRNPQQHKP